MGWVWSTHVELLFVSSLEREVFGQHKLRCILSYSLHDAGMVNTYLDYILFFSLLWEVFFQHMLRYILCSRWHMGGLVNTCWDTFCFQCVWTTHIEIHFGPRCLVDPFYASFCNYAGIWGICSTHIESILCHRWHGTGFVNVCCDTFFGLVGIGEVWSIQAEIHFVSSPV